MANKLQQILDLQNQPFYSNGVKTQKDKEQFELYFKLKEQIEKGSKKLKKGDNVLFVETTKIKNKKASFGYTLSYKIVSGKINKAFYNKKRNTYGEEVLIPTIKVETDTHIIEVSPDEVIKN